MSKLVPLNDQVVVKRLEAETTTPGGILLPDGAQKKEARGIVVAVGPGAFDAGNLRPMRLKSGDQVIFGDWSGTQIKLDAEEFTVMREAEILCKVEK